MGLFNKEKKREAEQAVLQKMMKSELVDVLVSLVVENPDYEWMRKGKHGDSGRRNVTIEPCGLVIEIPGSHQRTPKNCFVINFEELGYERLDRQSGQGLSESKMCFLYASALNERLAAELKECKFGSVYNDRDQNKLGDDLVFALLLDLGARAKFSYYVPVPAKSTLF